MRYDPDFQFREHFYGYSIACLEELCVQRGYALIDLEYNNAFLVPTELAGLRALTARAAYFQGYLTRSDRREKFHRNENMEILQTVSPEEGVQFIQQFFAQVAGKYELSIGKPTESGDERETNRRQTSTEDGFQLTMR